MTLSNNITKSSSFEDIVFQNRNKTYGAYNIRKSYNRSLTKGLLTALSLFSILFFLHHSSPQVILAPFEPTGPCITVDPTFIHFPKTILHPAATHREAINPNHIKLSRNENANLPIDNKPIVPKVINGINGGGMTSNLNSNGDGEFPHLNALPAETQKTFLWIDVSKLPLFPGGTAAMLKFISDNTHFPEIAKETGGQGTVCISFVVSDEGKVTDINIVKKAGYGFDEEAIRVIGSMPDWVPGEQNGKKVNVRMIIPIKFTLK